MEQRRLQLILDEDTDRVLKEVRARKDVTYTATIRRAVALFKVVLDAQDAGGGMQIVDKTGKVVRSPRIL